MLTYVGRLGLFSGEIGATSEQLATSRTPFAPGPITTAVSLLTARPRRRLAPPGEHPLTFDQNRFLVAA
jgi:hypothetical protein